MLDETPTRQATTPGPVVFLVDDDMGFLRSLGRERGERGYQVVRTLDTADVELALSQGHRPRFAVIDLKLEGESGLDVVQLLVQRAPGVRAVVLTGHGSIASSVAAMKRGAVNYLTKPVTVTRLERAMWMDEPGEIDPTGEERRETLAEHEQEYIDYVLMRCEGNVTRAARWLGIYRQSLQRKLRRLGRRD